MRRCASGVITAVGNGPRSRRDLQVWFGPGQFLLDRRGERLRRTRSGVAPRSRARPPPRRPPEGWRCGDRRRRSRPRAADSVCALQSRRARSLMALPRPRLMSMPECPPRSPVTGGACRSAPPASALPRSVAVTSTSAPPALPMVKVPSTSESTLIRREPRRIPGCSASAPVNPSSSLTVKSASRGPCVRSRPRAAP